MAAAQKARGQRSTTDHRAIQVKHYWLANIAASEATPLPDIDKDNVRVPNVPPTLAHPLIDFAAQNLESTIAFVDNDIATTTKLLIRRVFFNMTKIASAKKYDKNKDQKLLVLTRVKKQCTATIQSDPSSSLTLLHSCRQQTL